MSENSSIEWTDTTWNPVTGCTKVSPGCAHCYAETFAERFRGVPGHPFEQGFDLKLWPERLSLPLSWKKPRRVFVNSMSDLFHEEVPFEFIDRVFAVMALAPQHTFQVLTKRPERMREYMTWDYHGGTRDDEVARQVYLLRTGATEVPPFFSDKVPWPLPNVWLGTSTENQRWLDIRVPELLATPAAVRFLSCEPLLGPLDLGAWLGDGNSVSGDGAPRLQWIIVGGESGPKARPMDVAWARSIVEQCRAAGVAVFVKQLGAKPVSLMEQDDDFPRHGWARNQALKLKSRKGGDMEEWPEDLRVREMPPSPPAPLRSLGEGR